MTFLLLNLLQSQTRLSPVVIVAAILVFIAGVSLLVYFYKRYKRIEKESEDEWDSSRRSLFVNAPPKTEETNESDSAQVDTPVAEEQVQARGTREFAADLVLPSFSPAAATEPEPQLDAAAAEPIEPHAAAEPRPTEILASPAVEPPVAKAEHEAEAASFDEEVWAGLEIDEKPPLPAEREIKLQPPAEPLDVARVEQSSHREPFEPPRIEQISREPYEPTIEPLTPREAAATRELAVATPGRMPEPSIPAATSHRVQSGSILGLPAERSHQPLILGEPVRPAGDVGIGALTNYGKDLGPKGGRAGTIVLLLVVALLAAAAGSYFLVPAVHSRVGDFIARLRGADPQVQQALMKPKAQVFPSTRPEVNKNLVTARGAVENISDALLENLTVEVSLTRAGGAPPEIRTVPVTPSPLAAGERGVFEFEYDGKRDTGFAGYTITRLFSNGTEVRFRAPGQK